MQTPSLFVRAARLSRHDARLLLTTAALTLIARAALRTASVATARRRLQPLRHLVASRHADQRHVAWALAAVGRRWPFAKHCLIRALVGELLLADGLVPLRVRIGVRRRGAVLEGHAWLERGGAIVGEPAIADGAAAPYTAMVSWDTPRVV